MSQNLSSLRAVTDLSGYHRIHLVLVMSHNSASFSDVTVSSGFSYVRQLIWFWLCHQIYQVLEMSQNSSGFSDVTYQFT